MERIIGRQADFLKKTDGSLVAGVSLVERTLTAISGLEQMQIIQDDLKIIQANVVSGAGYTSDSERQLTAVLNEVFGSDVAIRICHVPALQSTARGKYRFAICNV